MLLVLLVPIGVPAGTMYLLWRQREQLLELGSEERDTFSFLVADYKPQYYFYEVIEMSRKVTLVGLLIFLDQGSALQLVVAIIVVIMFLVLSTRLQPNVKVFQNNFKMSIDTALLVNLVLAVMMKVDLTNENVSELEIGFMMLASIFLLPVGVVIHEILHGRLGRNQGHKLSNEHKSIATTIFKSLDGSGRNKLSHQDVLGLDVKYNLCCAACVVLQNTHNTCIFP